MNVKMSVLNLFRHGTRSFLSLATIVGAFVSIVVFRGYSGYLVEDLKRIAVENQYGHLQIGSEKLWAPTSEKLKDQLHDMSPKTKVMIESWPQFVSMSPRLSFQALLSHEDTQFGAKLIGYDPQNEANIFNGIDIVAGTNFPNSPRCSVGVCTQAGAPIEILLGSGLLRRLKVQVGDTVSVVNQTIDGVINAMDMTVRGAFETTMTEIDDQLAFIDLKTAQTLLDTEKVENWLVTTRDMDEALGGRAELMDMVKAVQPELTVKTWRDLAIIYNQVEDFYDVQNFIIEMILLVLTLLAILNTVGMTVYERTGEIGTMRSLGLRRSEIIGAFLLESFFLFTFSVSIGSVVACGAIFLLNNSGFEMTLPLTSVPIPIMAVYSAKAFLLAGFCAFVATFIGTLIPAWRASRISITDALRHNI